MHVRFLSVFKELIGLKPQFLIPFIFSLAAALTTASSFAQTFPSNVDESKVPAYTLLDPLRMANGKKVTGAAQWNKVQRPYLYRLYQKIQFGKYPTQKIPFKFRLRETDPQALQGTATRKQVRIFLHPADTAVYMDVLLYLPNKAKEPVPVFMGYNFSGNHTVQADTGIFLNGNWMYKGAKGVVNNRATDAARGADSSQWAVREILAHGYALATAYYGDLEPDHADGWKTGIRTTLKDVLKIQPEEWSAMGAWAWGLSRMLDYLQQDKTCDGKKVAVMGFSRLGKAALWAGASDRRFSLVVSNESGEGGASLSKRFFGETVKIITTRFPHWFGAAYKTYGDNTDSLPVDGHMLLSLIAPRPLYVASAEEDTWSDPKGEFISAREASRVYALFGKKGITTDTMPPLHQPTGHTVRYHIRAGKHDVQLYDWQQYLKFANHHWEGTRLEVRGTK